MKTAVIVNPHSDAGRTGAHWPELRSALEKRLGALEYRFTGRPGHATELAGDLLRQGFERIIGVGGDGTFHEIANGFVRNDQPVRPGACLALLPAGTGSDLRRTLGLPAETDGNIEVLATGVPLPIDLGKITYEAHAGGRQTCYFVNLTSFGMGGDVSARAKNIFTLVGGQAAFFWATIKTFFTYRGKVVALLLDGEDAGVHRILNIAAGNGPYHGGGMHVCPLALLDDGMLEITIIEDLSLFTLLRDLHYLYDGNIHAHPKVRHFRVRHVVATASQVTRIEVDGESLGRLPVEISVVPRAIDVLVASSSSLLH